MKISQLKGRVQTTHITVPGGEGEPDETVEIKFTPGGLDLDALERSDREDISVIRNLLGPVLVSWDLQNDDGSPLGVTGDDLGRVPVDFLAQVLEAITGAMRPNPPRSVNSEDGSLQTDDLGSPQNGSPSSQQQGTFA